MRRALLQCVLLWLLASAVGRAADYEIIKVLPHLLDKDGRHTVSPSLFDRDAYQDWLRKHPGEQSGIRYDIQWRSRRRGEFKLRLELLGRVVDGKPRRQTLESEVASERSFARWNELSLTGEAYREFGPIVAWRVSLWQGDEMLTRYQSFLWE